MARPFVEFVQQPPVILSCSEKAEVRLRVKPRAAGTCKLTLSLVMQGCQFGNGLQKVSQQAQAQSVEETIEFVFNLFARADAPGNYFTILIAQAENANGEMSFQRPIELEIHCKGGQLPVEENAVQPTVVSSSGEEAMPDVAGEEETSEGEVAEVEDSNSAEEEEEEDSEPAQPEELPPETAVSAPVSRVVEGALEEMGEGADEMLDGVTPRVTVSAEKPKGEQAEKSVPSGKSKSSGGCLGVLLLLFSLFFWSACKLENPELGVLSDEVIVLQAEGEAQEILADGQSRLGLTATLGPKADANQTIVFFTEFGGFAEAAGANTYEVVASAKSAKATLVAGTTPIDGALITASVGGFMADYPIDFIRALPQDAVLTADKLVLAADGVDFTRLYMELFREEGQPSEGAKVNFSVELLSGNTQVLLVPFAYSEGSVAQVELRSANAEAGVVRITASTEGESGVLERSLELTFE